MFFRYCHFWINQLFFYLDVGLIIENWGVPEHSLQCCMMEGAWGCFLSINSSKCFSYWKILLKNETTLFLLKILKVADAIKSDFTTDAFTVYSSGRKVEESTSKEI